jgi:phage tail tape-measure protein
MSQEQQESKARREEHEKAGSIAGVGAGALAGAQVGTVILPIPVVGTFAGALVGGIIGSRIGKRVGSSLSEAFNSATRCEAARDRRADEEQMMAELERLGRLRDQGLLTEEEFKAAKAKILGL